MELPGPPSELKKMTIVDPDSDRSASTCQNLTPKLLLSFERITPQQNIHKIGYQLPHEMDYPI